MPARPTRLSIPLSLLLAPLALAAGCRLVTAQPQDQPGDACRLLERDFGPAGEAPVEVTPVCSGLEVPWALAFLPGGDLLVTERPGRIRLIRQGALVPEPVATVPVAAEGEGGLLGIALQPDFASERRFVVYYTAKKEGRRVNRIQRFRLAPSGTRAEPEAILLDDIPAARFHNGGRLRFGPDGMLYVGTGDARQPSLAQDTASLAGKLLRLAADGSVPPDNPFPGSPVFLTGIRNTQGFDWLDAKTLVVADHGPSGEMRRFGHDEISVARAGDNLGWPVIWGCERREGMMTPRLVFRDAAPPGGAARVSGAAIPEWQGSFLFGTLRSRHLLLVHFEPGGARVARHAVYLRGEPPSGLGRVRDVVQGPDGAVYLTTSNCDGRGDCPPEKDRVLRITRRTRAQWPPGHGE